MLFWTEESSVVGAGMAQPYDGQGISPLVLAV